jgi:organic hydroperoxide reductase OsmC/OhrA
MTVTLDLEGAPLVATKAVLSVDFQMSDDSDLQTLIDHAWLVFTVANSLNRVVLTTIEIAWPLFWALCNHSRWHA